MTAQAMRDHALRGAQALWRSRAARTLALLCGLEVLLGALFTEAARGQGLLPYGGAPRASVVALGVAYVVARVGVRFAAPAIAGLLIARAALARLAR